MVYAQSVICHRVFKIWTAVMVMVFWIRAVGKGKEVVLANIGAMQ